MSRKIANQGILDKSETAFLLAEASSDKSQSIQNPRRLYGCNTSDFIKNRAASIMATAEKLPSGIPADRIHEDTLYSLLSDTAQLNMVIRSNILGYKDYGYPSRRKKLCSNTQAFASAPPNTYLRLTLPPLAGQRFKGSYDVYWLAKIVLEEYFSSHPAPALYGKKLILIYKKYARETSVNYTCDNDNWESKRVTNAISEALNYSDNAEHFSMMYTAVKSDFDCVEATVINQSDLPKFMDYLIDPVPAQPLPTIPE